MGELLPRLSTLTDRATLGGGLIAIRKRDPSSLFTQHPCAVPRGSDCAVRGSFPRPAPRGIAFSRRWFPDRYRVTLSAVYLCCTFPEVAFGGRYPLSLPCGARTFLTTGLSAWPRDCLSYSPVYFTGIRRDCQRLAAMRPPHRRKPPGPSAENTGWPADAVRSRLHGPAALGEKVWEGEGRGCIFFRSAV